MPENMHPKRLADFGLGCHVEWLAYIIQAIRVRVVCVRVRCVCVWVGGCVCGCSGSICMHSCRMAELMALIWLKANQIYVCLYVCVYCAKS
jgi:hypothetical protein